MSVRVLSAIIPFTVCLPYFYALTFCTQLSLSISVVQSPCDEMNEFLLNPIYLFSLFFLSFPSLLIVPIYAY